MHATEQFLVMVICIAGAQRVGNVESSFQRLTSRLARVARSTSVESRELENTSMCARGTCCACGFPLPWICCGRRHSHRTT